MSQFLSGAESHGAVRVVPFEILAVFPAAKAVEPVGILLVPANGFLKPAVKGELRHPTNGALQLVAIVRIAAVMSQAVGDELLETLWTLKRL